MTDSNRFELIHGGDNVSASRAAPRRDALDAQLAAYVDGFLDEDERAEVQARLAADPALAAEVAAIRRLLPVIRSSQTPAPPSDMVQKVRARIAAQEADVPTPRGAARPSPAWRGLAWASGIAAVAAAAAFVIVATPTGGGASGVNGAGMGFSDEHRAVTITVQGADAAQVAMRASEAGLHEGEAPLVFEGTDAAVTRFLFALRNEAGATVRGFVPEAPKLRLTVQLK